MSKTIFSLLIMLPFFILIGYIFGVLFKKPVPQRLNIVFKWKNNLLIATGYLAVLVLLATLATFLDQGKVFQSRSVGGEMLTEVPGDWREQQWRDPIPPDGRFEEGEDLYKNSSQTFRAEGSQLKIKADYNSGSGQIFLERKESADGLIEVSTYVAPHYARFADSGSIDYTKLVAPPQISLAKETLKIEAPPLQRFIFKGFDDAFTVSQFKQEVRDTSSGTMSFGAKGILIRVPLGIEVIGENGENFEWVQH